MACEHYKSVFEGLPNKSQVESSISGEDLQKLLPDLRALRLWHWRGMLLRRKAEQYYAGKVPKLAEEYKTKADFHLKQVQLLNSFFPVGDTAEKDDK